MGQNLHFVVEKFFYVSTVNFGFLNEVHCIGNPLFPNQTFRNLFPILLPLPRVDKLLVSVVKQLRQVIVDHMDGATVERTGRSLENLASLLVIANRLVSASDDVIAQIDLCLHLNLKSLDYFSKLLTIEGFLAAQWVINVVKADFLANKVRLLGAQAFD